LGLLKSEHIFASNVFGAIPALAVKPFVALCILCLISLTISSSMVSLEIFLSPSIVAPSF
jgi:hypothetical protein